MIGPTRPQHDPTKLPNPGAIHTVDRSGKNSAEALSGWIKANAARTHLDAASLKLEAIVAGAPRVHWGKIQNAVLMVAGFPETADTFAHQIRAAAEAGLFVIAVNLPGWPGSEAPADKRKANSTDAALELAGLLENMQIDRAVVVGHDWGSTVVSKMATLGATKDRVAALGLLNNSWDSSWLNAVFNNEDQRYASRYVASLGAADGLAYASKNDFEVLRNAFDRTAGKGAYAPPECDTAIGRLRQGRLDSMLQWYRNLLVIPGIEGALLAVDPQDLDAARAKFGAFIKAFPPTPPVRFDGPAAAQIIGANDPYITKAASTVPADVVPNLKTQVLPTTSHFAHRESPDDVSAMVIYLAKKAGMT